MTESPMASMPGTCRREGESAKDHQSVSALLPACSMLCLHAPRIDRTRSPAVPTTIPYDPSLALGNIVPKAKLDGLLQISALQAPIDAAEEVMNSLIELKRSVDLTAEELQTMGLDALALKVKAQDIAKRIQDAALNYANVRVTQEEKIQDIRSKMQLVNKSAESPVDFNRTDIKPLPLSADSLKLNAQYFQWDQNDQNSSTTMTAIKGFVSGAYEGMGGKAATEAARVVQKQISSQRQNHQVDGTLIITAVCTHKEAQVLAPFILDIDKAIRVWNEVTPVSEHLDPRDVAMMNKAATAPDHPDAPQMQILSGATFGSSFIGMVHILKRDYSFSSQEMSSKEDEYQGQVAIGLLGQYAALGAGEDDTGAKDIKNLLARVDVQSHVSLYTTGVIPTIKSNELQMAVKAYAAEDWNNIGAKVATLQNNTQAETASMAQSAAAARTGSEMVAIAGAKVSSTLSALGQIDGDKNKVLDINSLMAAFEDYVDKVGTGKVGVPITYYLKPVTRVMLAQMWGAKYFPSKFVKYMAGDDAAAPPAAAAAASDGSQ
jgi:hypothetical protein